ncbi:MAG: UDP-N-acetylmuramoyl-L-alanyl-D-glutamate--2,6-diaminopimelate ligase [Verrucomicrobia bacterium]|nr:UDP-N-acetylmuramoyl-L-alanyl-D-glutamate--2,6-diaminopimelate ligase [Verrucomicrobiota bacterium]MDA1085823.1 UDP-N-acetylmuramoyl-L-alanyl-D-glutamate--2,6-diaminopimelate ligase [Verrucomicrobiota bacterium]
MELVELLRVIEPSSIEGSAHLQIEGVESDSRLVREGFLYVAIPGRQHESNAFVHDAVERGATAIVTERPMSGLREVAVIQVADSRAALASLVARFFGYPAEAMTLLGVTGTNGKTTTTHLIAQVLEAAGLKTGLIGTIQYRIGRRTISATRTTPEPVELYRLLSEMRDTGCENVVMEVSSHAIDQKRIAGLPFKVAAFTNLSRDHLDYHETTESYFETKARFIRSVAERADSSVVLNTDDARIRSLAAGGLPLGSCIRYGLGPDTDVRAEEIQSSAEGSRCRVHTPWGSQDLSVPLPGDFNLSNALAALACCVLAGIPLDSVLAVLDRATTVPGRMEEVSTERGFRVIVDYAHTDDALSNVLRTLKQLEHNRLILVFGCGGDRDPSKRPVMGGVASELADHSIITSDNPRGEDPAAIIEQIQTGFSETSAFESVEDRRTAIARAIGMAERGDIVLVAGKGHENFQDFGTRVAPFDDRAIAREILAGT